MQAWLKPVLGQDFRQRGPGVLLSLLLHGALLLAALWYLAWRPVLPETRFQALPVDLVIGGAMLPGSQALPPAARLQIARPTPDAAPRIEGTRPDSIRKPSDPLTAQLQALAQARTPDRPLPHADASGSPDAGGSDDSGEGHYALKDYIRAQILRRWLPDLSIPGARNLPVAVRVRLLQNGVIDDVTILDQSRFFTDKPFRNMALSARDAALLASPITLPPGNYQRVTVLTINLDPKAVLR